MLKRLIIVVAFVVVSACSRGRQVGDLVQVEWKGKTYPAVITEVIGKERFKIHYDGFGSEWDEIVGNDRIMGAPPK